MRLGIRNTIFLLALALVGLQELAVGENPEPTNGGNHANGGPQVGGNPTLTAGSSASASLPASTPREQVNQFFNRIMELNPFTRDHFKEADRIVSLMSQASASSTETSKDQQFRDSVQRVAAFFPQQSEFKDPKNQAELVEALKKVAASKENSDTQVLSSLTRQVQDKGTLLTKQEELEKVKKDQTESEAKTKKEQEQIAKQKQAEEIQKALEQQALASAIQQAAQQGNQGSGGGSGSGSGSGGNSNRPQPPEPPKFDNSQPKHDSLADKLDKALNNNQSSKPDLSSLFNNNNQNSDSFSKKDKEKKDDFKFDLSPKTKQNEVQKASAKPAADPDSPIDPSSGAGPEQQALANVISGPTSTPQLISSNGSSAIGLGGNVAGGSGAGGGGFSGKVNNPQGSGGEGGGAQDIFNSVGRIEYGDLPPPIRKASPEFSGSGGEGDSSEGFSSSNPANSKKESLVNELVLLDKNPRAKGLGLMALVGYQMKEVCQQSAAKKLGFCKIKASKNREEKLSLNKF